MKQTPISKAEYFRRNNYTILIWAFIGVSTFLTAGIIMGIHVSMDGSWYFTNSVAERVVVGCSWFIPLVIRVWGSAAYRRYKRGIETDYADQKRRK